MEKAIREYIKMIEDRAGDLRLRAADEEDDLCERLANEYCAKELEDLIVGHKHKVLKNLLASTKNVSASTSIDKSDGWIKWGNGKQPVDNDVVVYIHRKHMSEPDEDKNKAGTLWWGVDNSDSTIIAYKIVEEKKPEKQTLMEYAQLVKVDVMSNQNYRLLKLISEYLEKQ